jgi:hypothetical protein
VDRSDYRPFRVRKVPYLFFTTGENPHYHSPTDTADSLDYLKLEAVARLIQSVVLQAGDTQAIPRWSSATEPTVGEAIVIRDVMKTLLEHRDQLSIKPVILLLMNRTVDQLDAIVARGSITPAERTRMVRAVQAVLFSVL